MWNHAVGTQLFPRKFATLLRRGSSGSNLLVEYLLKRVYHPGRNEVDTFLNGIGVFGLRAAR